MVFTRHNFYQLIDDNYRNSTVEEIVSPKKSNNTILNLYIDDDWIKLSREKNSKDSFRYKNEIYVRNGKKKFCFHCQFFHSRSMPMNKIMYSFVVLKRSEINDN